MRAFDPLPSAAPATTARLQLLGAVSLRGAADAESAERLLAQQKHLALLALLALHATDGDAPRFLRRDRIVGLLWPELSQERARNALSKALSQLRAALGAEALVTRGDEEVALRPGVLACDAREFRHEIAEGRLTRALERYRGELLEGFHLPGCAAFSQWLDDERAELRAEAAGAVWATARRLEGEGQLTDAASLARRAVRVAWDDERALRRALAMLDRLGDRAGALALYEEFARRLRTDHDAEPAPETQRAAAALRAAAAPG